MNPRSLSLTRALLGLLLGTSCRPSSATEPQGPSCEEQRSQLLNVLHELPTEVHGPAVSVGLPTSAFNGTFTKGPLLELGEGWARLLGEKLPGKTRADRVRALRARLEQQDLSGTLLIAASSQTDTRTLNDYLSVLPNSLEPRLLFRIPTPAGAEAGQLSEELDLPDRVLLERDPVKRTELSRRGYEEYARCSLTQAATAAALRLGPAERWPALAESMPAAIAQCPCGELSPEPLRRLLVAEQRAGTAAMGSVSAAFLKDLRCRASMPLRSVQQILGDIDEFDAEFSGNWRHDALVFDQVVTDERLLVYLCNSMPGDVLSEIQRDGRSLFIKQPDSGECEQWRFAPIARGAPMGSLEPVGPKAEDRRFHFRQAGNEIRLFGPATGPKSLATDDGPWACDEDHHLGGVGETQIDVTENGTWFFTQEACQAGRALSAFKSCIHSAPPAPSEEPLEPSLVAPAAGTSPSD